MDKLKFIKDLEKELIEITPQSTMKVHIIDSPDEDPIIAPWLYIDDVAINIEDDGRFKYLDYHNEEHPIYFDSYKACLDYLKGYFEACNCVIPDTPSQEYTDGFLKSIKDTINYLVLDHVNKEIEFVITDKK